MRAASITPILSLFQARGEVSMTTRACSQWMAVAVCAGAFAASMPVPVGAADGNKACGLLTPAELQIVLGTTVSLSGGGGMAAGGADLCTSQTSTATVRLRLSRDSTRAEIAPSAPRREASKS